MIYVNARFLTQNLTGVQRFAKEISLQLSKLRDDIIFLSPPLPEDNKISDSLNIKVIGKNSGHLWEQFDLPFFLIKNNRPLLLNLCSTAPIFYDNQIITHHDITYVRYPQSFSFKFRLLYKFLIPLIFKHCHKIITVSNFSKHEISKHYKVSPKNIEVIYNAVNNDFFLPNKESTTNEKYFLAVSSPNYHKNFHGLLKAFESLNIDSNLKIIGNTSASFNKQSFKNFNKEKIIFLGRVDDLELKSLYQNAYGFIFPSFYEGFGIPPLEAQACGCPVLSSDQASMREVLGNSAYFFNPFSIEAIQSAIMNFSASHEIRDKLIDLGKKNISRFSWFESSKKISNIIDEYL